MAATEFFTMDEVPSSSGPPEDDSESQASVKSEQSTESPPPEGFSLRKAPTHQLMLQPKPPSTQEPLTPEKSPQEPPTPEMSSSTPSPIQRMRNQLKKSSYRDFSHVKAPKKPTFVDPRQMIEPTFVMKLHKILSMDEFNNIIAWLPHGRAWRIINQAAFEERVIPLFFRHGKYSSFSRQVNGWGFVRITMGRDFGAYYHERFLRGLPHLSETMRRLTRKDETAKRRASEESPPDLAAISRRNPVPLHSPPDPFPTACFDSLLTARHRRQLLNHLGVQEPAMAVTSNQLADAAPTPLTSLYAAADQLGLGLNSDAQPAGSDTEAELKAELIRRILGVNEATSGQAEIDRLRQMLRIIKGESPRAPPPSSVSPSRADPVALRQLLMSGAGRAAPLSPPTPLAVSSNPDVVALRQLLSGAGGAAPAPAPPAVTSNPDIVALRQLLSAAGGAAPSPAPPNVTSNVDILSLRQLLARGPAAARPPAPSSPRRPLSDVVALRQLLQGRGPPPPPAPSNASAGADLVALASLLQGGAPTNSNSVPRTEAQLRRACANRFASPGRHLTHGELEKILRDRG